MTMRLFDGLLVFWTSVAILLASSSPAVSTVRPGGDVVTPTARRSAAGTTLTDGSKSDTVPPIDGSVNFLSSFRRPEWRRTLPSRGEGSWPAGMKPYADDRQPVALTVQTSPAGDDDVEEGQSTAAQRTVPFKYDENGSMVAASTLTDDQRIARLRAKHYRLLSIFKQINDRIGRGPSIHRSSNVSSLTRTGVVRSDRRLYVADNEVVKPSLVSGRLCSTGRVDEQQRQRGNDDGQRRQKCSGVVRIHVASSCSRLTMANTTDNNSLTPDGVWIEFDAVSSRLCAETRNVVTTLGLHKTSSLTNDRLTSRFGTHRPSRRPMKTLATSKVRRESRARLDRAPVRRFLVAVRRPTVQRRKDGGEHDRLLLVGKAYVRSTHNGWVSVDLRPTARNSCQSTQNFAVYVQVTDRSTGQPIDPRTVLDIGQTCADTDDRDGSDHHVGRPENVPYLEMQVKYVQGTIATHRRRHHRHTRTRAL